MSGMLRMTMTTLTLGCDGYRLHSVLSVAGFSCRVCFVLCLIAM